MHAFCKVEQKGNKVRGYYRAQADDSGYFAINVSVDEENWDWGELWKKYML